MSGLFHDGWCLLMALARVALPLLWPAAALAVGAVLLLRSGRQRREAQTAGERMPQ